MELFSQLTPYHWIALGLLLLVAEMLGASGFLLGAAVAALAMGAVTWIAPELSVVWQLTIYAFGAVAATLVYFQLFRDAQQEPARPLLNKRARRLIGHQFKLEDDLELNTGKVQIGDTMWSVESNEPLSKGTLVEVVDVDRMILMIAPR